MTVCLTAKELLCAAALLGVPEVIAIPDAFQNMGQRQLLAELLAAQQSLEEKGILQLDFDGNRTLSPAYLPNLETVLRSEKVIVVDAQLISCGQAGCAYYIAKQHVVRSVPGNGVFELSEIASEQAMKELCGLEWTWANTLSCAPCLISQRKLNQLKAENSTEALKETGMDDTLRAIIADAFSFQTNYYSYAFLDRRSGGKLTSLIFMDDARGAVKLTPAIEDDQNCILLEAVTQEKLKAELREAVQAMFQAGTEG